MLFTEYFLDISLGHCAQFRKAIRLSDAQNDSRATSSALADVHRMKSVMCYPILLRETVFGVLLVSNKMTVAPPILPAAFTKWDEDVIQYLGTVGTLTFSSYMDYLMSKANADCLSCMHRLLCYTSQGNINDALAKVNGENLDRFEEDGSVSSTVVLRPISWQLDKASGGGKAPSFMNSKSFESFCQGVVVDDEWGSFNSLAEEHISESPLEHLTVSKTSLMGSRVGSQLRLITGMLPGDRLEKILQKFGDLYFNLLGSTSVGHLIDEAQTTAKEFASSNHSYMCHVSAENGGSLVVSSTTGESILNLKDLPKEFVTALEWGTVTELVCPSRKKFKLQQKSTHENPLSRIIPGVKGCAALIVPLRSPQEYEVMDHGELPSSEMSRLMILTKDADKFSAFERDSVSLFAKFLSEATAHVSFRDSNSDLHIHKKTQMIGKFPQLENPFVILFSFSGEIILADRDVSDVFGVKAERGHYSTIITGKNEQLLRDIENAIENERGVACEDYLLTTPVEAKGGLVFDYSIVPVVDTYYSCNCAKCSGGSHRGGSPRGGSPRASISNAAVEEAFTKPYAEDLCQRKFQGISFIMLAARASIQTMSDFRAFCRTPSSNPAGWFDDVNSLSRVSEGAKNYAFHELRRSTSRPNVNITNGLMTVIDAPQMSFSASGSRSRSDSEVDFIGPEIVMSDHEISRTASSVQRSSVKYSLSSKPEDICTWNFNVLDIKDKALLRKVIYQVFSLSVNFDDIGVDSKIFRNYVREAASLYKEVIFHNFYHAACITHVTFMLMRDTIDIVKLPKTLQFGLLLSALVHDIHHPGNTNLFEINSKSELSILYNDQSVLENHHCSMAFRLMTRPGLNVLGSMKVEDQRDVRKLMIGSIMATDMSRHADLMEETLVRSNHQSAWNPDELTEQIFYAKILLHAADLSNPTRNFPVAFEWANRIAAEFNEQTKLEVAAGLPVLSFMVATDETTIVKNELSFSTYVVAPMWRGLVKLFPQYHYLLDNLSANASQYSAMIEATEILQGEDEDDC